MCHMNDPFPLVPSPPLYYLLQINTRVIQVSENWEPADSIRRVGDDECQSQGFSLTLHYPSSFHRALFLSLALFFCLLIFLFCC